jgi:hypothetical protein
MNDVNGASQRNREDGALVAHDVIQARDRLMWFSRS